jgi:hypothetical protein
MNRAFGIEIELKGATIAAIRNKLTGAGYTNWNVVYDGSVDSGAEVVSPKLFGEEGLVEMEKVVTILREMGCFVDHQCGLHVHIDGTGLHGDELANIVKRYGQFEDTIDSWFTFARRESRNLFLRSVTRLGLISTGSAREVAESVGGDRYRKVNITAFLRHGTVEFRQHHGTLNAEEIRNWIQFCVQFVSNSTAMRTVRIFNGNGSLRSNAIEHKFATIARLLLGGTRVRTEKIAEELGCDPSAVPSYMTRFRAWMAENRCNPSALLTYRGYGYKLDSYASTATTEALRNLVAHPGIDRTEVTVNFPERGLFDGLSATVREHFESRTEAHKLLESFTFAPMAPIQLEV